jgi:glycosyltransferase involved in cell wall biosynthesis
MEEFHFRLSIELKKLDVLPVIAYSGELPEAVRSRMESSGAVVTSLNYNRSLVDYYRGLRHIVAKYGVRLVQMRHFNYFRVLPWLVRLSGVRHMVFTEGTSGEFLPNPRTRPLLRVRTRAVTAPITRMVAVSDFVRRQLARAGVPEAKIGVIRNGVDTRQYRPCPEARRELRSELGIPQEDVVFATVSVLRRWKHLEVAVEAFGWLIAAGLPVHFLLAGTGEMRNELLGLAGKLGLGGRFRLLGHSSDPARLLEASDIFVLPSIHEACAKALVEAMACGLPIVASRSGGNAELILDGQTGLLAEPLDTGSFASAMTRLADDPALRLRMARASLDRAGREFSIDRPVAEHLRLYESIWAGLPVKS